MGAAFAGVFCGVLVGCLLDLGTSMMAVVVESLCGRVSEKGVVGQKETYGAEMESIFLLRIGSDILARYCGSATQGGKMLRDVVCW